MMKETNLRKKTKIYSFLMAVSLSLLVVETIIMVFSNFHIISMFGVMCCLLSIIFADNQITRETILDYNVKNGALISYKLEMLHKQVGDLNVERSKRTGRK